MNIIDSSINDIGWNMSFIYNVSPRDVDEILTILKKENADIATLEHAEDLLKNNQYNSALTYTNRTERKTIMVFTDTTAQDEFINSLVHETLHLSRHIANCGNSEMLCNALGNYAGSVFKAIYK